MSVSANASSFIRNLIPIQPIKEVVAKIGENSEGIQKAALLALGVTGICLTVGSVYITLSGKVVDRNVEKMDSESDLSRKVNQHAQKMGINPVDVYKSSSHEYEGTSAGGMTPIFSSAERAVGCNYRWSQPSIVLHENSLDFVVAHELGHIKGNHSLKTVGFSLASIGILGGVYALKYGNSLPLHFFATAIGTNAFASGLLHQYYELESDKESAHAISKRELAVGIRYFQKQVEQSKVRLKSFEIGGRLAKVWGRVLYCENGDRRSFVPEFPLLTQAHPPLSKRVFQLKEIFYSKNEVLPLTIEVKGAKPQTLDFNDEIIAKVREKIQQSNKESRLFDLERIVVYPEREKYQVEAWGVDQTPFFYSMNQEILDGIGPEEQQLNLLIDALIQASEICQMQCEMGVEELAELNDAPEKMNLLKERLGHLFPSGVDLNSLDTFVPTEPNEYKQNLEDGQSIVYLIAKSD